MQLHPGVHTQTQLTDRLVDPIEERVDVLVRIGELADSGMWARQIDTIRFGVFASPSYLDRFPAMEHPSDLAQHIRLGFLLNSGKVLAFNMANADNPQVPLSFPATEHFLCTDVEGTMSAAQQGLGLSYLPTFIANESVERKLLKPVLIEYWMNGPSVHLICPQPRLLPKRVKLLADFCHAALKENKTHTRLANSND
jgi:DNA-binding transcriptional LysR family regulator